MSQPAQSDTTKMVANETIMNAYQTMKMTQRIAVGFWKYPTIYVTMFANVVI